MSLVLREPQFQSVKARLEIARLNVKKAQVALERTKVYMPFNGQIIDKGVGVGSKISTNTQLFKIVNVEQFLLEVKIPRSFLSLLNFDDPVTLSQENLWGKGVTRQAKIFSVLPELDKRDRQARLLLLIDDPQSLISPDNPPVYINDFLNVSLAAKPIEDVWTIRSSWLQQDGSIWVVDKNRTLQKRFVDIRFKGRDYIYVDGPFETGDYAIAEKIPVASVGMPVRIKLLDSPAIKKDFPHKKSNHHPNKKGNLAFLTKEQREERKQQRLVQQGVAEQENADGKVASDTVGKH
jgi:multidrug efflux pump subunit AcrA (membrane-fusion protein)